ncbi:hypothetical protein ACFYWS_20375 [Streptomyces sp. NPDC002795]|uniref:zinc finger domain-containing protein n=1 Tax=Streptomyces sp. NPDC002795 TaxID=3364665 RepID=UPI003679CD1A
MPNQPTLEQIRHLIGHAEYRVLTPDESARLRKGVEALAASRSGLAARVDQLTSMLAAGTSPTRATCPTCRAEPGTNCRARDERPLRGWHRSRIKATQETDPQ